LLEENGRADALAERLLLPAPVNEAESPERKASQREGAENEPDGVGHAENLATRDAPEAAVEVRDIMHAGAPRLAASNRNPPFQPPAWMKIAEKVYLLGHAIERMREASREGQ